MQLLQGNENIYAEQEMPLEKAGILELTMDELHDLTLSGKNVKDVPVAQNVVHEAASFGRTGPKGEQGGIGERGPKGDTGPEGCVGPTGKSGDGFQIDEYGPLTAIAINAACCLADSVFVFLVTHDLRTGEDIIPPLSAYQDYSRHLLFCDDGEWFDYGRFTSVPGPAGPCGPTGPAGANGHIENVKDEIAALHARVLKLEQQCAK